MRKLIATVTFVLLAASLAAAPATIDGNWPTWRGADGTGAATGTPPVEWSESMNVAWKTELQGLGSATPVVWDDRVYVMTAIGEGEVSWAVVAYDTNDGSEVWRSVVREQAPYAGKHATNSYASASAVTDGEHIWAFFGSYGLYCLDTDGNVVWELDFGQMQTRRDFGEGASPALHGDALVVVWDQESDSWIGAFDKSTGDELWRVARDEPTTWATPLVVEYDGRTQVITAGTNRVRSYDLANGELLWDGPGLTLNAIPSPAYADGVVYLAAGFRGQAMMAVDLATASGNIDGTDAIRWRIDRDTPYVPSPLLVDDIIYYVKSNSAILSAMHASTGELLYGPERLDGVREIYASPVAANGYVYIVGRDGGGLVLRQGENYEVVAQSSLDDGFDASPVIIGDAMYLRGTTALYKIQSSSD
ncbi:MAG: PQQ-binding-like beta-propeller repeat protein [Acidobacteria bacterium]|nr:PQQ-binding-like beta-propeller repeat protein [Acidobacteriota bacterium]